MIPYSPPGPRGSRIARAAFTVAFVVYFLSLVRRGLRSWFSGDDLMNIWFVWRDGTQALVRGTLEFWGPYYRPTGQALYWSLYSTFGLHPLPFNVARLALVAVDVVLLYLFVQRLSDSRNTARVALVLAGFHAALCQLYFDTGMIYDVLAFLFYYLTLWLYIGIRRRGAIPGARALAGLTLLTIAAMNAKEIAVTLPIAVLLYELVIAQTRPAWGTLLREGRFVLSSGVVTLIYVAGKVTVGQVYKEKLYHPEFSLTNYLHYLGAYLQQFLFMDQAPPDWAIAVLLAACIAVALIARRRVLLWAALFNVFSVLPIAFIPPRSGFAFFVPLMGWTVFAAGLVDWLGACAARLLEPVKAFTPEARTVAVKAAVLVALFAWLAPLQTHQLEERYGALREYEFRIRGWYRDLLIQLPQIPHNSRVLIRAEPPQAYWHVKFLLVLGFDDRTLLVDRACILQQWKYPVNPENYQYILDFREDGWRVTRNQPHTPSVRNSSCRHKLPGGSGSATF